jgi:tripartite-type tricarboxylate transporter receptor subunit TctC
MRLEEINMSKNLFLFALGFFLTCTHPSVAQTTSNYPSKPITIIVPYGAGGSSDARTRQVGQLLSQELGQPVIVENKAGAGGNIGTEIVAKAKPDGYTIGMGNFAPLSVNKALFKKMGFDPEKDIVPIVLIEKGPLVLTVPAKSPYKNVNDVVAAAKAKPGVLTFASGGIGGSHHLSAELFKQNAGIDMIHVPYKSGSAATTDLLAGNVDMMFEQMYSALPNINSQKLRALATTSAKRSPLLPQVQTLSELGYPKVVIQNWQGFIAPAGTPKEIITKINKAVNKILLDPAMREKITSQSNEVGGGTPEEFLALIKSESAKWSAVVKTANIKPE